MKIGVPREIKDNEYRVAMTPSSVDTFVSAGHEVYVETGAGEGIGKSDEEYIESGAKIILTAEELWRISDMIYKVKEPEEPEYKYLREGLIVFCYMHMAANKPLVDALLNSGAVAIAFETIEENNQLPCLKPMSEIGGLMSIMEGANLLTKVQGGKGKLLQGLPGVAPSHVVVIGGGVAGTGAIRAAVGIGARVTVLDHNVEKLAKLSDIFGPRLETLYSNPYNIRKVIKTADLLVGAILVTGSLTPKVVTESMVKNMKKGSVIVDIAVDQGGCVETIDRITTHSNPTYVKHGIIHYAVAKHSKNYR